MLLTNQQEKETMKLLQDHIDSKHDWNLTHFADEYGTHRNIVRGWLKKDAKWEKGKVYLEPSTHGGKVNG